MEYDGWIVLLFAVIILNEDFACGNGFSSMKAKTRNVVCLQIFATFDKTYNDVFFFCWVVVMVPIPGLLVLFL